MANFTIAKGERRILPFRVDDVTNLDGFGAHFTVSNTEYGDPIAALTKTHTSGIIIDSFNRDVNIIINIVDFDYASGRDPGNYHYQLFLIADAATDPIPRLVRKGTITLIHSIYYQALA